MTAQDSNIIRLEEHATPEERASSWIARIDAGPLSADERQELRDWIASHPGNAGLLDTQAMLWSNASRAKFPQGPALNRQSGSGGWAFLFGRPKSVGFAVCSLALVALVVGAVMRPALDIQSAHYSTLVGKTSVVGLDDGSRLRLNTASSTKVAYTGSRRLIVLERGEGYFEVAKDRNRPFDVIAGDTIVRAVGTKFSVRQVDTDRIEVTVTEGVVELFQRGAQDLPLEAKFGKPVRLAQGQSGVQVGRSLWVTQRDEKTLEDKLAWLQGRLSFDGEALEDVVAQVNRYSSEKIVIADPSLRGLKVSGSFNIDEVPVFLNSLERGFGLRVDREGGVARIGRNKS